MARARPNAIASEPAAAAAAACSRGAEADHHQDQERPTVLTVWRKLLLPSCSGFTVFDASGAAAAGDRGGADGRGRHAAPILTLRRRRSSLTSLGLAPDRWLIFDGDAGCQRPDKAKPFLSVRRAREAATPSSSGKTQLAYVQASGAGEAYVVEGSYGARSCAVRGDAVADVRRKERLGNEEALKA